MTKFLNISTDNTLGGNSPSDSTVSSQSAIKSYVDTQDSNKLDKVSTATVVYGTNSSGNQTTYSIATSATASTVACRGSGGVLKVGSPTANSHATTKSYVDTAVGTKQDTLVSGTNIKTINNQSILGSGNIDVSSTSGGYHPNILSWEWDDHLRNDVQWLRGDTFSWQSGAVYQVAYQHLVNDKNLDFLAWYNNMLGYVYTTENSAVGDGFWYKDGTTGEFEYFTTPSIQSISSDTITNSNNVPFTRATNHDETGSIYRETETVSGITITFYTAADGHKICAPDQESNLINLYNATGVAWYYILDTTNQRFKLPRSKHNKYATELSVVGNGYALGLSNGSDTKYLQSQLTGSTIAYNTDILSTGTNQNVGGATGGGAFSNVSLGVTTDPTKSGMIAQQTQDTDQYKYLYFYVGSFEQTALENTAGLNAELFNSKADVSVAAHAVVEFQAPTASNNYTWYRKYADGWVEQGGNNGVNNVDITLPVVMADTNYTTPMPGILSYGSTVGIGADALVVTKTTTTVKYGVISAFGFTFSWQIAGMAA